MRYRAVLFDLDGTLIGLDTDEFIGAYFSLLKRWLGEKGIHWPVIPRLQKATEAMIGDDNDSVSNQDVFLREFFDGTEPADRDAMMRLFDEFYRSQFARLRRYVRPIPEAAEVVDRLNANGCTLVLATNPVFPRTAVVQRMQWGGLTPGDFQYITCYENSHLCKPHPGYYRQILQHISVRADEALMVGNDPLEDMAAEKLGIDTFLVGHYVVSRPRGLEPTYRGELGEIPQLVCSADGDKNCS